MSNSYSASLVLMPDIGFDGGRLTSDAGLLLLAAIEQRLKVAERLAACIEDRRDPERVGHGLAKMIMVSSALDLLRLSRGRASAELLARDAPPRFFRSLDADGNPIFGNEARHLHLLNK